MSGDNSYDWIRLPRLPTEHAHALRQLRQPIFFHHSVLQTRQRLLEDLNDISNRLRAH